MTRAEAEFPDCPFSVSTPAIVTSPVAKILAGVLAALATTPTVTPAGMFTVV
ncbi:MAG: hypothetical protein AAB658_01365 [Chloroflexota bacterium]